MNNIDIVSDSSGVPVIQVNNPVFYTRDDAVKQVANYNANIVAVTKVRDMWQARLDTFDASPVVEQFQTLQANTLNNVQAL